MNFSKTSTFADGARCFAWWRFLQLQCMFDVPSSHPSFPALFSRQALHWPGRRALQPLWWTEPSPPVNSAQKGSLHLIPSAALHSGLCHWQPNHSVLPLASAITSSPTQAHWKQWHPAQTQGAAIKGRLSKLPHMVKASWSYFQEGICETSKLSGVGHWWS